MGGLSYFSTIKGNNYCNFLFASVDEKTHPGRDLLQKERICSLRSKFFNFRKRKQNEKAELLPLNVRPFTLSIKLNKIQNEETYKPMSLYA